MNELFNGTDLRAYIEKNGPYMQLSGNIAPYGITIDLTTVPDDMLGMRGVMRLESTVEDLAGTLKEQRIQDGEAIFLTGQASCSAAQANLLAEAVRLSGRKHLACILLEKPEAKIPGIVNLWYQSAESAAENHALVLKNGDRVEYDISTALFGADLIECLDHRLGPQAEEPFYFRKLDDDIWIIGEEFTRMFLVLGRERALLIDAGFGYGDLEAAVRSITDLPVDVALTHGHFDHAGGIRFLEGENIYLHQADYPCVEARQGKDILKRLIPLEDGHLFELGGRSIRSIWLPGHSEGSMVFLEEGTGILFAGDSLLCGPFFLLNGREDVSRLADGLTRLLSPEMNVRTFYPAHRTMFPMTRDHVREIIALLQRILNGEEKGISTWIAPAESSPYKTYHSGPFSVYSV